MYNLDNEVFRKPIAFSCGLETQANRQLLSDNEALAELIANYLVISRPATLVVGR